MAAPAGMDWRVWLRSLRRRWFSALFLGLLAAGGAAAAAWQLVPAPYSAKAEFFIRSQEDRVFFDTSELQPRFDVQKQTYQKRLTSEPVLTAALRAPELENSDFVRKTPDPVRWLAQNLKVGSAGTEFITLSLEGDRPNEIAAIVNAVANAFDEIVVEGSLDFRRRRLAQLEQLAKEINRDLEARRAELKAFVERTDASTGTMLEQKQEHLLQLHLSLRQELADVDLRLIEAKIAQRIRDGEPAAEVVIPEAVVQGHVSQTPEYAAALRRIEQARRYLRDTDGLSDRHPTVVNAKARLQKVEADLTKLSDELRPKVVERLREERAAAAAANAQQLDEEVVSLTQFKAELERELEATKVLEKDNGLMNVELARIDGEITRFQAMSASLADEIVRRTYELRALTEDGASKPIEIFQKAQTPQKPELKKRVMMTGMAGGGAFGLVVAAIVFLDSLGRRISSVTEVSGELSTRLIGSIPPMPRGAMTARSGANGRRPKIAYWQHALKESVDAVRTFLLAEAARTDLRVIAVSSAISGEGKTTLACHLATSLARAGRRVALVDCDLRRPTVDRVFAIEGDSGLCEVLRGESDAEEAIQQTSISGLSILSSGAADAATIEMLSGKRFGDVIDALRATYDFVILDTAPVLPVCDGLLVARHADTVILAVRRDVSRLSKVAAALDRFASVDVPVMGAVAIGLDDDPVGYGWYRHTRDRYRYALSESQELVSTN
ncbi:MAG TPA: polysaccharide biosynthesis tyrosine autokinase [Planctomycetaceae bacterium]